MASDTLETELKLRAAGEGPLRLLSETDRLGAARLGRAREVEEEDVYLDTADGRLAAARWACRLRSRHGRTWVSLKGPAQHAPGEAIHRRPEVEGPAGPTARPAEWPSSPARDLILRLAADGELVERLTLRQHRTEREVTLRDGPVGILSLDRVQVLHAGVTAGTMLVVELELAPEAAELETSSPADALLAMPGLSPEPSSKLERALRLLAPPDREAG